ncbi:MAG TPA: glycosyltransferase family 8 protein, partial [Gallicola sp.]|nr:glycosyltransferase family 8 protein [Gallicola sp.]
KYGNQLLLPDQDILNYLYSQYIKEVAEEIWNYDTRKYLSYFTRSLGEHSLQWVMENTSILHFCGRPNLGSQKVTVGLLPCILIINNY